MAKAVAQTKTVAERTTETLQTASTAVPAKETAQPAKQPVRLDTGAHTELSAADATQTPLHIQTTRRITRVNLPKPPAFLNTKDNGIARSSSHDMLNNAMLAESTDSSRTVARSQTTNMWSDANDHRAASLIKNQKAIELAAHLQELSN